MTQFADLISYLNKQYNLDHDVNTIWLQDLEVTVEYDEVQNCVSIYREFTYDDYDNVLIHFETAHDEMLFLQNLYNSSEIQPKTDNNISWGYQSREDYVGFFNIELSKDKILEILNWINCANKSEEVLNCTLLQLHYPEEFEMYKELEEIANLSFLQDRGWQQITSFIKNGNNLEGIYVNENKIIAIGIGKQKLQEILKTLRINSYKEIIIYKGYEYCIGRRDSKNIYWNINFVNAVEGIIEELGLNCEYDINYYITDSVPPVLLVECAGFWGMIIPINDEEYDKAILERKKLIEKYNAILQYIPQGYVEETLDFSALSDDDFENMCKDILAELGFMNIFSRGQTNAPDGGVDIECDEEISGLLGKDTIHWIFQCKHSKKIDRKDLSEIPLLLEEFNAEKYGLFYSGTFSPQTLDRIKYLNSNARDCIKIWDNFQVAQLVNKFTKVKNKYFGI